MSFGRRFDDKLYKRNAKLWAYFDLPGGVWLTLFSGSMLVMWWLIFWYNLSHSVEDRMDIPTAISATYSVIVTAYAGSNIARWYRASKEKPCAEPSSSESSSL